MVKVTKKTTGSVTVEAAISLPVFLCVFISIIFLTKVVYTHEIIQHALTETAQEMASSAYLYHVSGLQEMHDSVRDGMQEKADAFDGHLDILKDSFGSFGSFENGVETVEKIISNPVEELKNIAAKLAKGTFDDSKTAMFTPLVKLYMQKYLVGNNSRGADENLKDLNIKDGLNGLDYSESHFFEDAENDIEIKVRYTVDFPVPIKVLPKIEIVQTAFAKAWLGGDESNEVVEENVWALNNFTRGKKLREIFGANLPFNFPVIARFEDGTATMIKSIDLTAKSYQNVESLSEKLDEYLDELVKYNGQPNPFGSKNIVIVQSEIKNKELILIIPKNTLPSQTEQILARYIQKAENSGVKFKIERYQTKIIADLVEN